MCPWATVDKPQCKGQSMSYTVDKNIRSILGHTCINMQVGPRRKGSHVHSFVKVLFSVTYVVFLAGRAPGVQDWMKAIIL